jgi:hypothetical protein
MYERRALALLGNTDSTNNKYHPFYDAVNISHPFYDDK